MKPDEISIGVPVSVGVHGAAAAGTALTDRVEAAEHRILEERVVYMSSRMFGAKDVDRFAGADPAGSLGMMVKDELGERLSHDQANIQRKTRMLHPCTTRTLQGDKMIRIGEHDIASDGEGDDVFQLA